MKAKQKGPKDLNQQESRIIQQLRQHPKIMEQVQKILELTENVEGPLKTADQIEELLIEEMRRLGSATMHEWASQAEERVSAELQIQNPTVLKRKKKR